MGALYNTTTAIGNEKSRMSVKISLQNRIRAELFGNQRKTDFFNNLNLRTDGGGVFTYLDRLGLDSRYQQLRFGLKFECNVFDISKFIFW